MAALPFTHSSRKSVLYGHEVGVREALDQLGTVVVSMNSAGVTGATAAHIIDQVKPA